ncbi:hypothetical protein I310_03414 [Cryptococcus deuterogattii CA1014]|nr:hypothetical protein I310_03414 [Cryptococcus deuterogattii CA1014]
MARDIPLLNEKAVRSKPVFHAPMDRWDRTVNFKVTGSSGEDGDDEDPEFYLTKEMADEEEIQESRYDILRPSLLEDPELELSYPPFLGLIKTREWNHWYQRGRKHFTNIPKVLPVDAETLGT